MIKVSVLYPNSEDAKFDIDYYCNKHMNMVSELLGDAVKGMSVESGMAGGAPGAPAPFIAMGHLLFDNVETFQTTFGPHANKIMGDIPNYTNINPQIQISEVKI